MARSPGGSSGCSRSRSPRRASAGSCGTTPRAPSRSEPRRPLADALGAPPGRREVLAAVVRRLLLDLPLHDARVGLLAHVDHVGQLARLLGLELPEELDLDDLECRAVGPLDPDLDLLRRVGQVLDRGLEGDEQVALVIRGLDDLVLDAGDLDDVGGERGRRAEAQQQPEQNPSDARPVHRAPRAAMQSNTTSPRGPGSVHSTPFTIATFEFVAAQRIFAAAW